MNKNKKIFLGAFLFVGTIIIVSAVILVLNMFMGKNVNVRALTNNLDDFVAIYNSNDMERDTPPGFSITESSCTIEDDTYTLSVKIKNSNKAAKSIQLQLYYNEEFAALRPNTSNPFVRLTEDDGVIIRSGEEKQFEVKGTLGKDGEAIKQSLDYIYVELLAGSRRGRFMLPITIK